MAGEPEAINGMDSTCLPNLFPVLYPLNEDVGKAFASQKPPDGSVSKRGDALKVGLEHAESITYPIWPWKFPGPAGAVAADRGCLDFLSF
ncbi:unnamed protein product [Tetraodon nigroviridis]|uniref:(spotted green pufferfish) hypothetical protein n=1 Tax=Tetraodon nigroviridis TaxID=99883 RepID=Q4RTF8_TETNG|nr:unnamed protein product [Tetraodon nigroviridis]